MVGVRLELPQGSHPASQDDGRAARVLLEALDFTAPAWIGLPIRRDWRSAMRVSAAAFSGAARNLLAVVSGCGRLPRSISFVNVAASSVRLGRKRGAKSSR